MIKDNHIDNAQADTSVVARAWVNAWEWVNAYFQAWPKSVTKATRTAGVKDDEGHVVTQLAFSKSPLKELSETAYREK